MSKRKADDAVADELSVKKQKKAFSVGPANLPDGTYRRKTQKIKNDLIAKAKVKKAYAKLKAQEAGEQDHTSHYDPYSSVQESTPDNHRDGAHGEDSQQHAVGIHPERQAMLNEPALELEVGQSSDRQTSGQRHRRHRFKSRLTEANNTSLNADKRRDPDRTKPQRYQKEFAQAEERKIQLEQKQKLYEERNQERRAMAKAKRPGKDGKPKLGRQSNILLSRVKRIVA